MELQELKQFELNRIKSRMKGMVERWGKSYASLPDVADNVRMWKDELSLYQAKFDAFTPSIQNARAALEDAYDNRDNREIMLKHAMRANEILARSDEEMNVTYRAEADYAPSMKSMMGSSLTQQYMNEDVVQEFGPIRMTIKGIIDTYDGQVNYSTAIKSHIHNLISLYEMHRDKPNVGKNLQSAITELERTGGAYKSTMSEKASFQRALQYLDKAIGHLNNHYGVPEKQSMTSRNINKVKATFDEIYNVYDAQAFRQPAEVVARMKTLTARLQSELNNYDEPTLNRYVSNAMNYLNMTQNAVKAANTWRDGDVRTNIDFAMRYIDEAQNYIRDL